MPDFQNLRIVRYRGGTILAHGKSALAAWQRQIAGGRPGSSQSSVNFNHLRSCYAVASERFVTRAAQALFERAKLLFGIAKDIAAIIGDDDLESGAILRLGTDSSPFAAAFMAALQQSCRKCGFG